MKLVLANSDYRTHMTDEGEQLQLSLQGAGWTLCGEGYCEDSRNVGYLLDRYQPSAVFVQDKRDWDPYSGICFNTRVGWQGIEALKGYGRPLNHPHGPRVVAVVVKDAGEDGSAYHRAFCEETGATAVVHYYHQDAVLVHCPWLKQYRLVRTYHTIDTDALPPWTPGSQRRKALGSGAVMPSIYPLRFKVAHHAQEFGVEWLKHPGYNNERCHTTRYLSFLSQYKVHFCCSSIYQFALRKIIESVAVGCAPITDLPKWDVLPEIDRALIRIKSDISDTDLKLTIQEAVETWDEAGRQRWAERARNYYDYRDMGKRLSTAILGGMVL